MADRTEFLKKGMNVINSIDNVLFPKFLGLSAKEVRRDIKDNNKPKLVGKLLVGLAWHGALLTNPVTGVALFGAYATRYATKGIMRFCIDCERAKGNKGYCGLTDDELHIIGYNKPIEELNEGISKCIKTMDDRRRRELQGLEPEKKQVSSAKRTSEVNQNPQVVQRRVKDVLYK